MKVKAGGYIVMYVLTNLAETKSYPGRNLFC